MTLASFTAGPADTAPAVPPTSLAVCAPAGDQPLLRTTVSLRGSHKSCITLHNSSRVN
jgi:hypothetical protein